MEVSLEGETDPQEDHWESARREQRHAKQRCWQCGRTGRLKRAMMEGKDGGKTWEEKDQDPDRESQDQDGRRGKELAGATAGKELGGWGPRLPRPQQISGGEGELGYMLLPPWLLAWPST